MLCVVCGLGLSILHASISVYLHLLYKFVFGAAAICKIFI